MGMLLVLVVIASFILTAANYKAGITDQKRREKTVLQMEQILSAGLSYYTVNGTWPVSTPAPTGTCGGAGDNLSGTTQTLQAGNYLPAIAMNSPWGAAYVLNCDANMKLFSVSTTTDSISAPVIAGMLPQATVAGTTVTAYVQVPGQNVGNARTLNFGGLYSTGDCVPVPVCPNGTSAQIMVVPAGVAGTNGGGATAYGIDSFQAYVTSDSPAGNPGACVNQTVADDCTKTLSNYVVGDNFWRVCLSILTDQGFVSSTSSNGNELMGSILAVTRCSPTGERTGSSLNTWY